MLRESSWGEGRLPAEIWTRFHKQPEQSSAGGKMPRRPELDPGAFSMEGGPVGCLLVHGFTGSPPEMRPLGDYLHRHGVMLSAPLLPGHGTTPDALNRVHWQDWIACAEGELLKLRAQCQVTFIAGLSAGALIGIHLAVRYGDIAGIVLYSPALKVANRLAFLLPVIRHIIPQWPEGTDDKNDLTDPEALGRIWDYETTPTTGAYELLKLQRVARAELERVRVPALVLYSTGDTTIHPTSAKLTFDGLGSQDKELVTLYNSGHCITVDSEREMVFARTWGFMVAHASSKP
jgi:carboxylesterase